MKKHYPHSFLLFIPIVFIIIIVFSYKNTIPANSHLSKYKEVSIKEKNLGPEYYHEIIRKKIDQNDFMFNILIEKFSTSEIAPFLELDNEGVTLRDIRPGDSLFVFADNEGNLAKIVIQKNQFRGILFEYSDEQVIAKQWEAKLRKDTVLLHNHIDNSLYQSVTAIGESPELAYLLSDIYSWQIDFYTDIRKKDHFFCLIEKYFYNNQFVKYGEVFFSNFINNSKEHYAVLYEVSDSVGKNYYDLEGKSVKKDFLKSPLRFRRISSGFSYNRFHPVLKIYRPHLGIDYAAPTGTPVWSVSDGKIVYAGWKGQGGNTIIIKHSGGYRTSYCHLHKIAKGIRVGTRVKQKQVIGYVGTTGCSTGPHLDYRIKRNGFYVNPLKMKPSSLANIPDSHITEFNKICGNYLEIYRNIQNSWAEHKSTKHIDSTDQETTENKIQS